MARISGVVRAFSQCIVARPVITILTCLLICSILFTAIGNLRVSSSPREFQGENTPQIKRLSALDREYVKDHNYFLMIKARQGSILTAQHLATIHDFTEAAWLIPKIKRVDSFTNFLYSEADDDDVLFRDMVEFADELGARKLDTLALQTGDPRLKNYLLSESGDAVGINLLFNVDMKDSASLDIINRSFRELEARFVAENPDLEFATVGYLAMVAGWLDALSQDVTTLYPISLVLIFLALSVFFRSISIALSTMLLALLSVASGVAILGVFKLFIMGPIAVGIFMILMLALADAIHVANSVRLFMGKGYGQKEAIVESIVFNFTPIALTSITTGIGFLSFIFSDFLSTKIMGFYVAFAVMVAFTLSVTLLPALLTFCKIPAKTPGLRRYPVATVLSNFVIRYRFALVLLTLPAALFSAYLIQFNEVDDNLPAFMNKESAYRQDQAKIESALTGTDLLIYSLETGEPEGINQPEYQRQVDSFVGWARTLPEVRHIASYSDSLKQIHMNMHRDNPAQYVIPDDRALIAQYSLLNELSLPEGLDLTTQVNSDKSAMRVVITISEMPVRKMLMLVETLEEKIDSYSLLKGNKANGSSFATSSTVVNNIVAMLSGGVVALVVIGGILLLAFRSVMPGVLSVVMVILPIIAAFGIWAITVGRVDLAACTALCMVIGIVVDNSVHFISKYIRAQKDSNLSPEEAVRYAFENVGESLTISAGVLSAGFSVLLFSAFAYNSSMAKLTILSVIISWFATFTLLPALLLIWQNLSPKRKL